MGVTIRDYQASDFEVCCSLCGELAQYHADIYEDPTIAGSDPGRGFGEYINNPACRGAWVAELDNQVVAFISLIVNGEEGEVEPVIVSSPFHRKGIGTLLVQHCVQEARKARVRFLSVRPVARNEEAISFFVRLGFNLVGRIDLFQDLSPSSDRKWKPGIAVHGKELKY